MAARPRPRIRISRTVAPGPSDGRVAGNLCHSMQSNASMQRFALILVACLFGCNHSTDRSQPASQPTTASTAQPVLKAIELHEGVYLARIDVRITVSADGLLRSVRTENKSCGGNDINPTLERIELREGRLTAQQMEDLARSFAGWDSMSSKPYGGVSDGPDLTLRYGDKTISGGSEVPSQVMDIRIRLSELATSMPVVKP